MEQRLVGNLQNTLLSKNAAINELSKKNRALKKVMQPRQAYKYRLAGTRNQSYTKDEFMDLTQMSDPQNFGQIYKEAVNNFDARSRSVAPTVSSKMDNEIKVLDEVSVRQEIAGA